MEKDPIAHVTERLNIKENLKRLAKPFVGSLHLTKRLLLAGVVVGAIACGSSPGKTTDQELRSFCQQLKDDNSIPDPFVGPKTVREPVMGNPDDMLINSNILLTSMSGNYSTWLTTDIESDDSFPVLSPDKQMVVFTRQGPVRQTPGNSFTNDFSGKEGIYTVDIDGTNEQRLTTVPNERIYQHFPRWSPDGKQIVFTQQDYTQEPPVASLYVISVDGSISKLLAQSNEKGVSMFKPEFSPDGTRIAFQDWTSTYVVNPDGQELRQLTQGSFDDAVGRDEHFIWLPNSEELLVSRHSRINDRQFLHRRLLASVDGWEQREVTTLCPPRYNSMDEPDN